MRYKRPDAAAIHERVNAMRRFISIVGCLRVGIPYCYLYTVGNLMRAVDWEEKERGQREQHR